MDYLAVGDQGKGNRETFCDLTLSFDIGHGDTANSPAATTPQHQNPNYSDSDLDFESPGSEDIASRPQHILPHFPPRPKRMLKDQEHSVCSAKPPSSSVSSNSRIKKKLSDKEMDNRTQEATQKHKVCSAKPPLVQC